MSTTNRNRPGVVPWIALALAVVALLWLGWSWSQARAEADRLRAWQATMIQRIATARGGDTPLTAQEAPLALARLLDRPVAIPPATPPVTADTETPPAPVPSANATTEISRLSRTQSTGTAIGDAAIIEQDSRAAWTGWK